MSSATVLGTQVSPGPEQAYGDRLYEQPSQLTTNHARYGPSQGITNAQRRPRPYPDPKNHHLRPSFSSATSETAFPLEVPNDASFESRGPRIDWGLDSQLPPEPPLGETEDRTIENATP